MKNQPKSISTLPNSSETSKIHKAYIPMNLGLTKCHCELA